MEDPSIQIAEQLRSFLELFDPASMILGGILLACALFFKGVLSFARKAFIFIGTREWPASDPLEKRVEKIEENQEQMQVIMLGIKTILEGMQEILKEMDKRSLLGEQVRNKVAPLHQKLHEEVAEVHSKLDVLIDRGKRA